jgi:hypothetical protein
MLGITPSATLVAAAHDERLGMPTPKGGSSCAHSPAIATPCSAIRRNTGSHAWTPRRFDATMDGIGCIEA